MDVELREFIPELVYKIKNIKLNYFPYVHCEVPDFLPKTLLKLIEKNFPEDKEFIPLTKANSVSLKKEDMETYSNRKCLNIYDDSLSHQMDEKKLAFWKQFQHIFNSLEIVTSFLTNHPQYMNSRYPNGTSGVSFSTRSQVISDKTNYALGPHTDNPGKLFTLLIYLNDAMEDEESNIGTSVYTPITKNFICKRGTHHKHEEFIKMYTSSFQKNNIFGFYRTDNSFHGVEKITNAYKARKLIQYSIWDNQTFK